MSDTLTPYKLDRPLTDDERRAIAVLRAEMLLMGYLLGDLTDEEIFEGTMNFGCLAANVGVTAQAAADALKALGRILSDE